MVEVSIPNNIHEYKPKFMLGLTGRQMFCVVLTAGFILLDFKFLKPYIGDLAVVIAAVPAFLAACFGWVTPYGMPFEKYLQSVLFQAVLAPKCRRARSALSSFVIPCDKYYEPIPDSSVSTDVLECVLQVRNALGIKSDEVDSNKSGYRKTKVKKLRYKKSKLAYL